MHRVDTTLAALRHLVIQAVALSLVVAVAGSVACGGQNTLSGSIADSHDLSFESVRLRLLTDQQVWELRYLAPLEGGGEDIVAKVVVDVPADGWSPGSAIDLLAHNGRIERITARNDPFPEPERAELTFSQGGVDDGDDTAGGWGATFVNGKTVQGTFRAPLEHDRFDEANAP
jgi:hypothetical protein